MAPTTNRRKNPVGLELDKKGNYKVGKKLGEGAFAQVYDVVDGQGKSTGFAAKITPNPPQSTTTSKTNKKKLSQVEKTANMLHHEANIMYNNQLVDMTGKFVPQIPRPSQDNGLKHYYHDLDGFRVFVMERMEAPLLEAISKIQSTTYNMGPIAGKLLEIAETIHQKRHVIFDVKTDNIMVAKTTTKNGKKKKTNNLEDTIRMVDFGLAKPLQNVNGHMANTGTNEVQGTPLYASLNVHNYDTPSRRDDVESMLYVLAEIILNFVHRQPKYGHGKMSSNLPWSQEGSDQDIGQVKEEQVTNPRSDFYKNMQSAKVAKKVFDALKIVRAYDYATKPNYEQLRTMLSDLPISKAKVAAKKPAKKKATATKSGGRTGATRSSAAAAAAKKRTLEESSEEEEAESPSPAPVARRRTTPPRAASRRTYAVDDSSEEEEDDERKPSPRRRSMGRKSTGGAASGRRSTRVDGEDFYEAMTSEDEEEERKPPPAAARRSNRRATAADTGRSTRRAEAIENSGSDEDERLSRRNKSAAPAKRRKTSFDSDVSMEDVENEDDEEEVSENEAVDDMDIDNEVEDAAAAAGNRRKKTRGFTLMITGEKNIIKSITLVPGESEGLWLGTTKPKNSNDVFVKIASGNFRLSLGKKNTIDVENTSRAVMKVDGMSTKCSKTALFANQRIEIAGVTIKVIAATLAPAPASMPPAARRRRQAQTMGEAAEENVPPKNLKSSAATKKSSKNKQKIATSAVCVEVVNGPDEGVCCILEEGHSLVVGKAPSTRGKNQYGMELKREAQGVADSHARLELFKPADSNKFMVKVTDLKTDYITMVDGLKLKSGKDHVAVVGSSSIRLGTTQLKVVAADNA